METISIRDWADFEKQIRDFRKKYSSYQKEDSEYPAFMGAPSILFRGQAKESWGLKTTLERKTDESFDVKSYFDLVRLARNELESFTGQRWSVPNPKELEQQLEKHKDHPVLFFPAYDYLVYLRHHGFPSPLLDWTESPYVAAYFAYLDSGNSDPAVYCFVERPRAFKAHRGGKPTISVMGPYVTTDKRHFAQKSWYTVATKMGVDLAPGEFCNHEEVFSSNNPEQDLLTKFLLPASSRLDALRALNDYNINHFTLFQSEDALVKALEIKTFDQKAF